MKRLLVVFIFLACSSLAYAAKPMQGKYNWTLGFDGRWNAAAPSGPDWDRVLNTGKSGFAVYLADRFTDIWSFEIGYSWTDRDPVTFTSTTGQVYFGSTATSQSEYTAKIRFAQTYLDFYAHIPLSRYIEGMMGLGAGWTRPGFDFFINPQNSSDPVFSTLQNISGRTSIIARFNVGLQALWTERVGVRILFSYQTTSMQRARGVTGAVTNHPTNNRYSGAIGIYWNFMGHD